MSASVTHGRPVTLEEWAALPKETAGELVDGAIVEDEDVGLLHEAIVVWFASLLRAWLVSREGVVGASDGRFAVSSTRGRRPDLFAYFKGRRPAPEGVITLPPDIIVEIVSPRRKDVRRDTVEKPVEYARFGVTYYWIVDPYRRTLQIFELEGKRYALAVSAADGVVSDVPGCEGLTIDLDSLWKEADSIEAG